MAIGRPQMEEQIQNFVFGGSATPASNTEEIDKQIELLRELAKFRQAEADLKRTDPRQFITAPTPPSAETIQQYETMLGNIYQGADQDPNIYDLASTLGASILSADPSAGAFRSMGTGFAQYGLEQKKRRQQMQAERRAIAMKAFELAKTDEDAANNLMNKYALEVAKLDMDNEYENYYVIAEEGITIGTQYYPKGMMAPLTKREASKFRGKILKGSGGGVKVPAAGTVARYLSEEDAISQVKALGLNENMPNFDRAVKQITASTPERIGKDIIAADKYMELRPLVQDGIVIDILLSPSTGPSTPGFATTRTNRLKILSGKESSERRDKIVSVIPTVDRALNLLMSGAETGPITEFTKTFKATLNQLFGTDTKIGPGLFAIQDLEGISNYLAPKMRPTGSGSTSDMEFKAYQNAILSLSKGPFANYVALYAFKKMTANSVIMNRKEEELFSDSSVTDLEVVNAELDKLNLKVFEEIPENAFDDQQAFDVWYNSLPDGAVIDNSKGLIKNRENPNKSAGPFVIKGWENRGKL